MLCLAAQPGSMQLELCGEHACAASWNIPMTSAGASSGKALHTQARPWQPPSTPKRSTPSLTTANCTRRAAYTPSWNQQRSQLHGQACSSSRMALMAVKRRTKRKMRMSRPQRFAWCPRMSLYVSGHLPDCEVAAGSLGYAAGCLTPQAESLCWHLTAAYCVNW